MLEELSGSANVLEFRETNLCHNSTELTARSRDTMGGRTITSREHFSRDDEGCSVGTEILEEVGKAVKYHESLCCCRGCRQLIVTESCTRKEKRHMSIIVGHQGTGHTKNDEEDGEDDESHQLNGLATPGIDKQKGEIVSRNQATSGQDQIPHADVMQGLVDAQCAGGLR